MEHVEIRDREMDADGAGEADRARDQIRPPQPPRGFAKTPEARQQQDDALGNKQAAETRAVVGDERQQTVVRRTERAGRSTEEFEIRWDEDDARAEQADRRTARDQAG